MVIERLIAAGYIVHYFDAEDLVSALDGSGDLPDGAGMDGFDDLMTSKYQELPAQLFADLNMMGIESPVLIDVIDGEWWFTDGHHRLPWALVHREQVPVVLVDETIDPIKLYQLASQGMVDYDYN